MGSRRVSFVNRDSVVTLFILSLLLVTFVRWVIIEP